MEIQGIYIRAFAGLKKYSLRFTDGQNLLYGPNEKGKSTVLEFIGAMFYGLDDVLGLRERVSPWDKSEMAGNIWFSHEGIAYELARTFAHEEQNDALSLVNVSENLEIKIPAEQTPGEFLFGFGRSFFNNSFFISAVGPEVDLGEDFSSDLWNNLSVFLLHGENTSERDVRNHIAKLEAEQLLADGAVATEAALTEEIKAIGDAISRERNKLEDLDRLQNEANKSQANLSREQENLVQVEEKILLIEQERQDIIALERSLAEEKGSFFKRLFAKKDTEKQAGQDRLVKLQEDTLHQQNKRLEIREKISALEMQLEKQAFYIEKIYLSDGDKALDPATRMWVKTLELKEKKKKRSYIRENIEALALAKRIIEEEISSAREKFMPILKKRAEKYMEKMTRGRYAKIRLAEDFTLSMKDQTEGKYYSIAHFSSGTKDQLYFAFRLAMSDYLSQDKQIPLLLDDVFLHYDEKRMLEALELLVSSPEDGDVQSNRQVILFTCQKRIAKLAERVPAWNIMEMP